MPLNENVESVIFDQDRCIRKECNEFEATAIKNKKSLKYQHPIKKKVAIY